MNEWVSQGALLRARLANSTYSCTSYRVLCSRYLIDLYVICSSATLFFLFYIFSSPFTGNRELRNNWTGYVYTCTALYIWYVSIRSSAVLCCLVLLILVHAAVP